MTSAGTTASVRAATISSTPPGGAISSTRSSAPTASGSERIRTASRTSVRLGLDAERDRSDVRLVLDRRARELQREWPFDALRGPDALLGAPRPAALGHRHAGGVEQALRLGLAQPQARLRPRSAAAAARDLAESLGARRRAAQLPRAEDRRRDAGDRGDARARSAPGRCHRRSARAGSRP